jgi:hypothetical protein
MSDKAFSATAATIFGIVALVHLLRLIMGWSIVIDAWAVPMWLSWVGLLVAGALSYFGMRLARRN